MLSGCNKQPWQLTGGNTGECNTLIINSECGSQENAFPGLREQFSCTQMKKNLSVLISQLFTALERPFNRNSGSLQHRKALIPGIFLFQIWLEDEEVSGKKIPHQCKSLFQNLFSFLRAQGLTCGCPIRPISSTRYNRNSLHVTSLESSVLCPVWLWLYAFNKSLLDWRLNLSQQVKKIISTTSAWEREACYSLPQIQGDWQTGDFSVGSHSYILPK